MAEVLFRAKLSREEAAIPWGFRLQGGVEYDKPLTLLKVVPESLAAKGGLHPEDIVVKLAGRSADDMTHKDAQDAIISAGNSLEIIVERAEVTINSPTAVSAPSPGEAASTPRSTKPADKKAPDTAVTASPTAQRRQATTDDTRQVQNATATPASQPQQQEEKKELPPSTHRPSEDHSNVNNVDNRIAQNHDDGAKAQEENVTDIPTPSSKTAVDSASTDQNHDSHAASDPSTSERCPGKLEDEQSDSAVSSSADSQARGDGSQKETAPSEHNTDNKEVLPSNCVGASKSTEIEGSSNEKHKPPDPKKDSCSNVVSVGNDPVTNDTDVCDKNECQHKEPKNNVQADLKGECHVLSAKDVRSEANSVTSSSVNSSELLKQGASSDDVNNRRKSDKKGTLEDAKVSKAVPQNGPSSELIKQKTMGLSRELTDSSELSALVVGKTSGSVDASLATTKDGNVQCCESKTCQTDASDSVLTKSEPDESPTLSATTRKDVLNHGNCEKDISPPSTELLSNESKPQLQSKTETKPHPAPEPTGYCPNHSEPHPHENKLSASAPPKEEVADAASVKPETLTTERSNVQNIPQSSHKDPPSSKPSAATITMVLTDVEKPHIKAVVVEDVKQKEQRSLKASKARKDISTSPTNKNDKKPGTITPITITNLKGVPLAQTVLKTPEPISRQTKAPTEEILIAPKPSVQIMSSNEQKDFAKLPASESQIRERVETKQPVSHEMKDFSKTAPWRVPKQTTPSAQNTSTDTPEHIVIHPWRKSRTEHIMSHSLDDRQLSAAADRKSETPVLPNSNRVLPDASQRVQSDLDIAVKPHSTLTYVGKRIESPPVESPIGHGATVSKAVPTHTVPVEGRDVIPPGRNNAIPLSHVSVPSSSGPNNKTPSPSCDLRPPQPTTIHFQAADPDLIDIPMPAVKEMVENLNSRLEAIAQQHPKLVEPPTSQELGLNYFRRSQEDLTQPEYERMPPSYGEREIFINTPPNPHYTSPMPEDITHQLLASPLGYVPYYEMVDTTLSPSAHRRRYSLPGGSIAHRHNQRRVRFAEPLESSVIEIEPRNQRLLEQLGRRRIFDEEGSMSDLEDYNSPSSLDAKLDRLERKNALSNASFQRHRNAKQMVQGLSDENAQNKPETFRDKVISFESLGETKRGDVRRQGRSGSRGFSLSIGPTKPGSIRLSLRGVGQPASQVALSVPSSEGHFAYKISSRTSPSESYVLRYASPSHGTGDSLPSSTHTKSSSVDSPKTIHIQYPPQEGVPTIQTQLMNNAGVGSFSPPQLIRQLTGRPGGRSPTNYSNTLQIDTSSRLQHRSPSPPNRSLSPNVPSDRVRLSPQRLATRLPSSLEQTMRLTSTNPGASIGQTPGFRPRQPSPTNPMAHQRSVSPQGPPARQASSPLSYQQGGPPSLTVPRNASPLPLRLQATSGNSVSPPRLLSPPVAPGLSAPQAGPSSVPQGVRLVPPRPGMTPRGHPMQQPPLAKVPPRMPGPAPPPYPMNIPRGVVRPMTAGNPRPLIQEVPVRAPGVEMGVPTGFPPLDRLTNPSAPVIGPDGNPVQEEPQGMFALFDKEFIGKFLQWHNERPEGLYESETYKLVRELDEESEDASSC